MALGLNLSDFNYIQSTLGAMLLFSLFKKGGEDFFRNSLICNLSTGFNSIDTKFGMVSEISIASVKGDM